MLECVRACVCVRVRACMHPRRCPTGECAFAITCVCERVCVCVCMCVCVQAACLSNIPIFSITFACIFSIFQYCRKGSIYDVMY